MRTPKKILLEGHRGAEAKLDAVRRVVVEGIGRGAAGLIAGAETKDRARGGGTLWLARMAREFWLEVARPARRFWVGLAVVWALILALDVDFRISTATGGIGASADLARRADSIGAGGYLPGFEATEQWTADFRPARAERADGRKPFETRKTKGQPRAERRREKERWRAEIDMEREV